MQKVIGQRSKVNSKWGFVRDIECACGYIATFETEQFKCPDCGRRYFMFSNNVELPNKTCSGLAPESAQDDRKWRKSLTQTKINSRIR